MTRQPSFDLLAPAYQFLEKITYGPLLHWCRTAHLDQLRDSSRALILGDGDGRFLVELLKANPRVIVDSLDISAGMLNLARRRVDSLRDATGRVHFTQADARACAWPGQRYDLIITNFFLDCFSAADLEPIIDHVAGAALPGAIWLDGDFRMPPGKWTRLLARIMLATMYLFFGMATRLTTRRLTDPATRIQANGFTLHSERTWLKGFLSSRLWVRTGKRSVSPRSDS
jgi:ubiquinone/menaquinone biosynthesis C-methylase UbiE